MLCWLRGVHFPVKHNTPYIQKSGTNTWSYSSKAGMQAPPARTGGTFT